MPRLDYLATLQDNVTPALARMADAVDGVGGAFSRARSGGGELVGALSRAADALREGFESVRETLSTLVTLRVLIIAASLSWALLAGAVRLGALVMVGGLRLAFRSTVLLTTWTLRLSVAAFRARAQIAGLAVGAIRLYSRASDRLAGSIIRVFAGLRRQGRLARRVAASNNALALSLRLATRGFGRIGPILRVAARSMAVLGIKAIAVVAAVGLLAVGVIALVAGVRRILRPVNTAEKRLALLGRVMRWLGRQIAAVTSTAIGGLVKGILDRWIPSLRSVTDWLRDNVVPALITAREWLRGTFGPGTTRLIEQTRAVIGKVREGTISAGEGFARAASAAGQFAEEGLAKVVDLAAPAVEAINQVIARLRRFSGLEIETPIGSIPVPAGVVRRLNAAIAADIAANTPQLEAAGRASGLATARALAGGYADLSFLLPDVVRDQVSGLARIVGERVVLAEIGRAYLALFNALGDPAFITALRTGELNAAQQKIVADAKAATMAVNRIRQDGREADAKADEEAEKEKARRNRRAAAGQIQEFLRTSGQLVRGNQDLAIALATIDAGIAIAGAFAHGTRYGPVYQAAYVATTLASLANTINSIRSLTPPAGIGGGSAPAVSDVVPAAQTAAPAQAEVNIIAVGETFTAQQLRDTADAAARAATGQLTA